jgi:CRP-like cAMP-binding protein
MLRQVVLSLQEAIGCSTMNKLLASLPQEDMDRISPHLMATSLPFRRVLYKQDDAINEVYFLGGGACSLVKIMSDGAAAEIATVGNEGVIGWSAYFGEHHSTTQVVIQLECTSGFRMPVDAFIAEMEYRQAFYNKVVRYSQALISQVMLTTVCNGLHSVPQRCCRCLLKMCDRANSNDLPVTHDLLAELLGVRRATVTVIIGDLQKEGVVESRRRMIRIRDRHRLEELSCECYVADNIIFNRLMPEVSLQGGRPWTRHGWPALSA